MSTETKYSFVFYCLASGWIGTTCPFIDVLRMPVQAQMFWGDVCPLSPSCLSLSLRLNAAIAHIYFISLMWVTPVWWPSASYSQIAASEAYLWHDLWAGVTPDSQKDCHCPATALNSRRRGALSALRQTRPPSLKRIKLFHHVGNEKAVITPN